MDYMVMINYIVIAVLLIPYGYILVRLISKAWHKSKNEERTL